MIKQNRQIVFFSIILVFIDQFFKQKILREKFLGIEYVKNAGSSFGIFSDILFYNSIIIFLSLFVIFLLFFQRKKILTFYSKKLELYFLVFFLSGALSNLLDRIFFSFVIDYINFFNLFIFNLADFFITLSAVILISDFLFNKKNL